MFYYDQNSVLIEIRKKDNLYIIGDQQFDQIPMYVLNSMYTSANWNRALKYFSKEVGDIIGYYMLKLDIYLDFENKDLILLTKQMFFKKIINQNRFKDQFFQKVLDHKHRHRLITDKHKIIDDKFIDKYSPNNYSDVLRIPSINRFIVNEDVDLDKYRFKDLIVISDKFDFKITNKNQRIYYINKNDLSNYNEFENATFIDLINYKVYVNAVLNWKNKIVLEIEYDDLNNIDLVKNEIINIFKNNFDTNLNWHLYNLTFDNKYLVEGILKVFENNDFIKSIEILDNSFKELKLNYFAIIFKDDNLINLIRNYIKTDQDLNKFNEIFTRYNY
ncbi:Hypothetical protein MYEA_4520 [Mycoplasma yeatsii 13926]|uniref:Uncharacterized protein n=1 Tax=Mycoplasma yeatsii 13926 TaxID=1188240 RepID=S6G6T7_9MOLU|nr:hypothetical protein [Mycoplasma yeatsii]EOA07093.1 Hypothetical protein MYEA_4520 [Mycoplasma yeatsii 13926]